MTDNDARRHDELHRTAAAAYTAWCAFEFDASKPNHDDLTVAMTEMLEAL